MVKMMAEMVVKVMVGGMAKVMDKCGKPIAKVMVQVTAKEMATTWAEALQNYRKY